MEGLVRGKGVVLSREDDKLVIRMPADGDESCVSHCETCGLCEKGKKRFIDVYADLTPVTNTLQEGAVVSVEYERRDPGMAAVLFFLPALLGLLIGGFAGAKLSDGNDNLLLLMIGGGFLLGALVSWLSRRRYTGMIRPKANKVVPLTGE